MYVPLYSSTLWLALIRLQINNYELGVVIPLHSQEEVDRVTCWERPPQKYVAGRDEPWVSDI